MDADPRPGLFVRALRWLCRALDWTRKLVFGALAILALLLILGGLVALRGPRVPDGSILVVRVEGNLVEQLAANSAERATRQAMGQKQKETLAWDVVDALKAAKGDRRIKGVFLDLNSMGDVSEFGSPRVASLEEVERAIQDFRQSGKKVIAAADAYTSLRYHLAAQADEVFLHDLGFVVLEGLGRYRTYYKDALDKLEVDPNVIRVGEFKSAVEPFLRNDMSPEDKLASREWMGDIWHSMLEEMAAARKLKPADLEAYANDVAASLKRVDGDAAMLALEAHLVDRVGPREDVRARLVEIAGEDRKTHSYKKIELDDYIRTFKKERTEPPGGNRVVAVVVAKGEIKDGEEPAGAVGGDSTAAVLRRARLDDKVKAIVLRVDSPGGSGGASEIIREECAKAREAGKPVVISMGALAASGGYWISSASDEIWASPNTLTGSIGIFALLPTLDKPLAKYLGIHSDGVGTTRLVGGYSLSRPLDGEMRLVLEQLVQRGYREFLERVAQSRKKSPEEVDAIGRGRVWSGLRAQKLGLVDKLGGFSQAVASAAERAKLGGDYKVQFFEKESTWHERLLLGMSTALIRWAGPAAVPGTQARVALESAELLEKVAGPLTAVARPMPTGGIYAYCEECPE